MSIQLLFTLSYEMIWIVERSVYHVLHVIGVIYWIHNIWFVHSQVSFTLCSDAYNANWAPIGCNATYISLVLLFCRIEYQWISSWFVAELLMHCAIQCLNKMQFVCLNLVVVAIIRIMISLRGSNTRNYNWTTQRTQKCSFNLNWLLILYFVVT